MNWKSVFRNSFAKELLQSDSPPRVRALGVEPLEPRTVLSGSGFMDGRPDRFSFDAHDAPPRPYPSVEHFAYSSRPYTHRGALPVQRLHEPIPRDMNSPLPLRGPSGPAPISTLTIPIGIPTSTARFSQPAIVPAASPILNLSSSPGRNAATLTSAAPKDLGNSLASSARSASRSEDVVSLNSAFADLGEEAVLDIDQSDLTIDRAGSNWWATSATISDWQSLFGNETSASEQDESSTAPAESRPGSGEAAATGDGEFIEMDVTSQWRAKRKLSSLERSHAEEDTPAERLRSLRAEMLATDMALAATLSLEEWKLTQQQSAAPDGEVRRALPEDDGLLELQVWSANLAIPANQLAGDTGLPRFEVARFQLEARLELYQAIDLVIDAAADSPGELAEPPNRDAYSGELAEMTLH
jgi:hypothetical protein